MSCRNRPEASKRVPQPSRDDLRYVVPVSDLLAAVDRLEVAVVAHADAVRRGDELHATITGNHLADARTEFREIAERACKGTEHLRQMLKGLYEHLITHDGRRLAVRLRPWVR